MSALHTCALFTTIYRTDPLRIRPGSGSLWNRLYFWALCYWSNGYFNIRSVNSRRLYHLNLFSFPPFEIMIWVFVRSMTVGKFRYTSVIFSVVNWIHTFRIFYVKGRRWQHKPHTSSVILIKRILSGFVQYAAGDDIIHTSIFFCSIDRTDHFKIRLVNGW